MSIDTTINKLKELKLPGMVQGLNAQLKSSHHLSLPFEDRLGDIVDHEVTWRNEARLKALLRHAKLPTCAQIEDLRFEDGRNLERNKITNLSNCLWVDQGYHILITGATGTGKTFLALALGYQCCLKGWRIQFHKMNLLLDDLKQARIVGEYRKRLAQLNKFQLLILDDFALKSRLDPEECELLHDLLDGRQQQRSTIVTSQLPTESWHTYLRESYPTTADSILDRLLSNPVYFNLTGASHRQHRTPLLA